MVRYAVALKVETIVLPKWRWEKLPFQDSLTQASANNDAELARMEKVSLVMYLRSVLRM